MSERELTPHEAADIAEKWVAAFAPHSRRVFSVLINHARSAPSPAEAASCSALSTANSARSAR